MAGLKQLNWASEGVGATAAALVDLSTVASNKISNPPWVKFQSAGWVNFPSAPTKLAAESDFVINFGHHYFYSGNKVIAGIHSLTGQLIIPFVRDYKAYVLAHGEVAPQLKMPISNKIFIVHGHDNGVRETVARFLERMGFEAIILHEQANQGRTVIEKVEAHGDVSFAVVLLTPDDEGCVKGGVVEPRARQNVLLELGYFIGRLGRNKVCALKSGQLEIPSDFAGVVWESMDAAGGWKQALGRELQAAGHDFDWNKLMRP